MYVITGKWVRAGGIEGNEGGDDVDAAGAEVGVEEEDGEEDGAEEGDGVDVEEGAGAEEEGVVEGEGVESEEREISLVRG